MSNASSAPAVTVEISGAAGTPLSGIVPPVVTPRTASGDVDVVSLRRVVEHLVTGPVDGLFILGSSGEVPYLTDTERAVVVATVVDAARGRVPVLAGASEQTSERVVQEGLRLVDSGVDALVVSSPFYALADQNEIVTHFSTVRERIDLPLYAYDVPVRTHHKLSRATIVQLAEAGVLAGVKDSSGDDVGFRMLSLATRHLPAFRMFTGHEVVVDGALLGGAHGAVPGLANVDPAGYARMFAAAIAQDWATVRAEQDRLAELFTIVEVPDPARVSMGAGGLGAFKTALQILGVIENNRMSAPMQSLDQTETEAIRRKLERAGLI